MMPYYPARDGHPSMFTLDDNASAATVEPIHCTIRTFKRRSRIGLCGVRNVMSVKATVDVLESEARRSLQSQMPPAFVTSADLLAPTSTIGELPQRRFTVALSVKLLILNKAGPDQHPDSDFPVLVRDQSAGN